MHSDPIDFGNLIALLLVAIASREVAHAIGPYAAIIVGAFAGAGYSLTRQPRKGIPGASWHIIIKVCGALVLAVPTAYLLQSSYSGARVAWTVAPIAFLIGFVDWDWAWKTAMRKVTPTRGKQ